MYFSRGNPVIYYGDEQGFTGAGGDQDARQDMFPSQDLQYNNLDDPIPGDDGAGKNDDIGSDETPMDDNFDPAHPLYRELAGLAAVTREHPALRDGAQQNRFSSPARGDLRVLAHRPLAQHEYVVALNNAEQPASASDPDVRARQQVGRRSTATAPQRLRSGADKRLDVDGRRRCRRSSTARRSTSRAAAGARDRR